MNGNDEMRKCMACNIDRPLTDYISKAGRTNLRQCIRCRDRKHPKCIHDRHKGYCKDCGTGRCIHDRQKGHCKDCGTGHCIHNKQKTRCKLCSDPIEITIRRMIYCSKTHDKKYNRYDADRFIDYDFIKQQIFESKECGYCFVEMQFIENSDTLCTIERLNNDIGHIKSNCILACRKCNYSRVGDKLNIRDE